MRMSTTTLTNINLRTICTCSQCQDTGLSGEGAQAAEDGWICKRCRDNYYWCSECGGLYLVDELRTLNGDHDFYVCATCAKAMQI